MIALVAAAGFLAGVTLREREASPSGQVTSVSINGVVLKDSTQTVELSWDRVASVDGEFAVKAAEFEVFSERLWRARRRMERGDLVLAEPSLESLASEFPTAAGQTGMLMHAARTSCRLLRGAQVGAMEPYSKFVACFSEEEIRLDRVRPAIKGLDMLPARVRPAGILVPDFPPMWLDVPSLRLVVDFKGFTGSLQAQALMQQYIAAAKFEAGLASIVPAIDAGEDGDLVHDIVVARAGDKEQRAKARDALTRRIKPGIEEWRESWIRVGVGRSLIREESSDDKLAGVAEMLHAPARFAHATPYLAGIALADSAVTLRAVADRGEADRLVMELKEKFPRHPAIEFKAIREWHVATPKPAIAPAAGGTP